MEVIFVDANIFLEILLEDKNADNCQKFLEEMISVQNPILTSDFAVYSCLIQAQYRDKGSLLRDTISFFRNLANLKIMRPSLDDMYSAVSISSQYNLDFDDALVVSCMKTSSIKKLASLDKHFDKVRSIERIQLN